MSIPLGGPSVTIKARSWQVGGQSDEVRETKVASCCLCFKYKFIYFNWRLILYNIVLAVFKNKGRDCELRNVGSF